MSNPKDTNEVQLSFEVLAYWFNSAVEAIKRYDPETKYYDEELARKKERGYEMAVKTVDALKDVFINLEIKDEREELNNE